MTTLVAASFLGTAGRLILAIVATSVALRLLGARSGCWARPRAPVPCYSYASSPP
jgi:hypothetical protein